MGSLPVSVIIVAKNAENTIEECLESVRRNSPAEIIVVDGNSTDRTVEIARRYTERIYSDEGKGFNYAGQLGAEQATQEYIAFVDADITLPEGTLVALLAELKSSECVSMQARLRAPQLKTYWERATDWNVRLLQTRRSGGLSAAVLKRDTVFKYAFDTSIGVGSDLDFKIKVERDGHKVGTSSSTFVYHHHTTTLIGLVRQRFRYGREAVSFIKSYGPWHLELWPPVTRLYWFAMCLIKGRPNFIPYFIVDCMAQTAGMVKGFLELAGEAVSSLCRKR